MSLTLQIHLIPPPHQLMYYPHLMAWKKCGLLALFLVRFYICNACHDDIFTNLKLRCISKIYCPGLDSGWPHGHTPSTSPWPCHCMYYGSSNLPLHSSTITPRLYAWLVISAIQGSCFLASSLWMNWMQTSSHTRMVYSVKTQNLPS